MAKKAIDYAIHGKRSYGILIAGHYKVAKKPQLAPTEGAAAFWLLLLRGTGGPLAFGRRNLYISKNGTGGFTRLIDGGIGHRSNSCRHPIPE